MKDNYKFESVLYPQVREKLDGECAAAGDDRRIALEALADMLSERVKCDSDACRQVLEGGKTLSGAYEEMRKTAQERVKIERGKIVTAVMDDREAREILLAHYGVSQNAAQKAKEPEASPGLRSIYDFL